MPDQIVGTNVVPVGIYRDPDSNAQRIALVDSQVHVVVVAKHDGWSAVRLVSGPQAGAEGWTLSASVKPDAVGLVLDRTELLYLFGLMRDARFTYSGVTYAIPYKYPKDGCFARAEVMAGILRSLGYTVDKEFAISRSNLHVDTPYGGDMPGYGERLQVGWWYHVAPLVYVQTGGEKPDGWVLDPSVARYPVTPLMWAKTFATVAVDHEMAYETMRQRLEVRPEYPSDRTWLMRAGAVVYSLPRADAPRQTMEAKPDQPERALAEISQVVPAHEVIAAADALFRACFKAQVDGGMRDAKVPFPDYPRLYAQLLAAVDNLYQPLRGYIRNSFPNFITDWKLTFVGSGIDSDVKELMSRLGA